MILSPVAAASFSLDNASFTYVWNSNDELIEIQKVVASVTSRKILTWSGGNLVAVSAWVVI